jgi:hypothetical protein
MKLSFLWILMVGSGASCSSGSSPSPNMPPSSNGPSDASGSEGASAAVIEDFDAGPTDFDCLKNSDWTTVGVSHYKNMLGHTADTLAVARSEDGGTYPVGTIVQLVPGEAIVKRGMGFSADSRDWEFFALGVSDAGTTVSARGGGATVANARGTCLGCHAKAAAQWDLVCGDSPDGGSPHGCDLLPVTGTTLAARPDPRCP